jgi:hypothetical protein
MAVSLLGDDLECVHEPPHFRFREGVYNPPDRAIRARLSGWAFLLKGATRWRISG